MKKNYQIGVMGSSADLKYAKEVEKLAEEVGQEIAKQNCTLVFGAEKDYDSLSTAACRGAKKEGGLVVGFTYEKGKKIFEQNVDFVVVTGLVRGGGRETPLVLSCDGIITIGGGSGTLTEIAIAYQANIPIVSLSNTGGWSEKLSGEYLDDRKRVKVIGIADPEEAVKVLLDSINDSEKS